MEKQHRGSLRPGVLALISRINALTQRREDAKMQEVPIVPLPSACVLCGFPLVSLSQSIYYAANPILDNPFAEIDDDAKFQPCEP